MSQPNLARFSLTEVYKKLNITEEDRKKDLFLKKTETGVFFLIMNRKINTFNANFVRAIHELLDEVEANEGPTALVTFGLSDKFFSTGIDLNFMMKLHPADTYSFVLELIRLFGRMLALSVPTIAMINGHAYAGGCMFSFSHDFRFMRNDFGQICMNEVELGMPLPPGMNAVVQDKMSDRNAFREMILQAKRFEPKESFERGLVNKICSPETLLEETLKFAESQAKFGVNKPIYKKLKEEMNKNSINMCFNAGHAVGVRAETPALFPNPKL